MRQRPMNLVIQSTAMKALGRCWPSGANATHGFILRSNMQLNSRLNSRHSYPRTLKETYGMLDSACWML
jgi:hypothetical protein